jgi:hypothetical protein
METEGLVVISSDPMKAIRRDSRLLYIKSWRVQEFEMQLSN